MSTKNRKHSEIITPKNNLHMNFSGKTKLVFFQFLGESKRFRKKRQAYFSDLMFVVGFLISGEYLAAVAAVGRVGRRGAGQPGAELTRPGDDRRETNHSFNEGFLFKFNLVLV